MKKEQFIAAGILILASVGLVLAIESTPKAETASQNEYAAAKILELEHKIDVQEKLIVRLKKQLRDKTKENRNLKILCKQYNIPESAYKELMRGPRKQRPDGAVEVLYDKNRIERKPHNKGIKYEGDGRPLGITTAKIGETGWLNCPIVVQVIDDANAIAKINVGRCEMSTHGIPQGGSRPVKWVHRTFTGRKHTVWLKGISTKDVVNGDFIEINHMMKITGTTTYETAVGSNTIFVIEKTPYYFPRGYGPEGKLRRK